MTATRAPACLASWIAIVPMPLPPPWTSSVSPAASPAVRKTLEYTVQAVSGSAAASMSVVLFGDRKQLPGRDGHLLGVAAAGQQRADLLADVPSGDAVAEGRHGARALEARIGRRARRRRVEPLTLHEVGPVDAGRGHLDENLARPRPRVRDLGPLENFRASGLADHDRVHSCLLGGNLPN